VFRKQGNPSRGWQREISGAQFTVLGVLRLFHRHPVDLLRKWERNRQAGLKMASKKDQVAIDVTWDDQRNICTFGRVHNRFQELQIELKRKKDDIEKLSDAADEVLIADDVKYVFGEAFVTMDADEAGTFIENRKAILEKELATLQAEEKSLEGLMTGLKAQLYAKFGSQIYLESE
jgi:prefoldin subunit 4